MGNLCDTCPLRRGIARPGQVLEVCGDSTAQCEEFQEDVGFKMEAWRRLGQIAEIGSSRVLDMRLLRPGDYTTFHISPGEGRPYRTRTQAGEDILQVTLEIKRVTDEGFATAIVDEDKYYASGDHAGLQWPMESGEEIVLLGSCDDYVPGDDSSEDYTEEGHIPGMLHVGRLVTYTRGTLQACDFLLQEVVVWDPAGVEMTVFDTDPYIFRPAYHPKLD